MIRYRLIYIFGVVVALLCNSTTIAQQVRKSHVERRLDSLRNLFTGHQPVVSSNPANAVIALHIATLREARTMDNCSYLCTPAVVLPVTGLELEGERINETSVRLKWKTFSETDNLGFDIERRFGSGGSFTASSFVRGAGNSVVITHYQTIDPNGYEGTTFYRLKQKDIDGHYNYSNMIAIKGIVSPPGIRVYPNPGTNATTIFQLTGFKDGEYLNITICDVLGRVLGQKTGYPSLNQFTIPLRTFTTLPSGLYTILVNSESKKVSSTFVIVE